MRLLMRGARFELNRRRAMLSHVSHGVVTQAADDALVAVLATHSQDEMCRRHRGLLAALRGSPAVRDAASRPRA